MEQEQQKEDQQGKDQSQLQTNPGETQQMIPENEPQQNQNTEEPQISEKQEEKKEGEIKNNSEQKQAGMNQELPENENGSKTLENSNENQQGVEKIKEEGKPEKKGKEEKEEQKEQKEENENNDEGDESGDEEEEGDDKNNDNRMSEDKQRSEDNRKSKDKGRGNSKDKKRKKKQKKKKKVEEIEEETDYEQDWVAKMAKSSYLEDPNLPEDVKKKYAFYENNPCVMIVSSVPSSVSLKEIEEYFNTLIVQLNTRLGSERVIKNVEYGPSRTWVALECTSLDAKKTLIPLGQVEFSGGNKLRVEKPRRFLQRIMSASKDQGDNGEIVKYEDCRLYMGGLPQYLLDDDVKKLIHTFGSTKYFNLVKDHEGMSKGYCFFEYEHPNSTGKALRALNGLQIADRRLKVCKVDNQPVQQSKTKDSQPSNYAGSFLASCELVRVPEVYQMLTIPQSAIIPSKVVQFLNMISTEDLFEDDIYDELMDDLKSECQQFGHIEKIEIPRPHKETGYTNPAVGKIFVKFQYQISAKKCKHRMAGRTYNKRTVITSFYPEEKFNLKDYLING